MKLLSTIFNRALLCTMFCFFFSQSFSQTTIIPYGSNWKYLDNGTNQGTAWRATGFADGAWASGPAELGYGDAPVTTVSYGPDGNNKYITTYFRKAVTIANPSAFFDFTLNVRRDDGIVVYVNGTERYRNNLTASPGYLTTATNATDNGDTPQTTTLSSAFFSAGNNVIAVEIHQTNITSSDMTFDLELLGNTAPVVLINFGDTWKYRDNNTRPANWETVGFNDAAWASGASELGYGDAPATAVSYGPDGLNKYITTYFRKTFNVTGLNSYNGFTMNLVRDDGVVVYINGTEVARDNMPGGTPAHGTHASAAISGAGETTPIVFNLSPCNFVEGVNTIAVEMHQSDAGSSDLSFNLELNGNVGGGTPTLSRGPYLQSGSETAITVRWRTSSACYGRVSVGTANGVYTTATADETTCPTTEHIVRVTGLASDTKYFYQVSATDGTIFQGAADNFFRTNPAATTTRKIRIAAFGDCGRGNATYQDENLANYQSYLSANGIDAPDAWILLGDNAYNSGTDAEYTSKFFGTYGGNILKNHKLYPSPGNHDYGNSSANKTSRSMPYHSIFTVPQNGESGGVASGKQNYYSYDIGNIHFLSLDAYGTESDGTSIQTNGTSMVKTWLDADLAANTKKWTIAYWHHPPYTKTSHNSDTESDLIAIRQNFIGFLESRGVDLIINGHSHGYERGYLLKNFTGTWTSFNPAVHAVSTSSGAYTSASDCPYIYNSTPANHGTVYVVAGSTGASGGVQADFDSHAFPYSVNDGGMLYFEVEDNRLDAKMLRRNGTIFDRFTIIKDINTINNHNQTVTVNTPVTLTASWPGTNHTWSTTETTRSVSFTPTVAGTTNFAVTDGVGCITDNFTVVASSTLPVLLLSYDAILTSSNKVKLNWSTASESNNQSFTIERSGNGSDFSIIGSINAVGNSSARQDYSFVDESPLTGTSYYRLSQTDIDNRKEYLGIRRIANNVKEFDAKTISSSGGKLVLQFNAVSAETVQLQIYDINGRKLKSEKLNVTTGLTNKEVRLANGIYIWEVRRQKGEVTFQKVIVQ